MQGGVIHEAEIGAQKKTVARTNSLSLSRGLDSRGSAESAAPLLGAIPAVGSKSLAFLNCFGSIVSRRVAPDKQAIRILRASKQARE